MVGQISNKVLRFLNLGRDQGSDPGGCGGGAEEGAGGCSSGGCSSGGCGSGAGNSVLDKKVGRRGALGMLLGGATAGASVVKAQASVVSDDAEKEQKLLEWEEYFKGNFRQMSDEEKAQTVDRLTSLAKIQSGRNVHIKASDAQEGVLYGYAFNISKCKGYRECVKACVEENNLDRDTEMQYIRIFEMKNGEMNLEEGDTEFHHQVPAEGHFYIGTQCFQCADPPCTKVCPVGATWQEPDGITVVDYDWCIGCRYCQAACPYWARRFNWSDPAVPAEEINPNQHYLGNRARKKGVMEKCTFCIQRTREGRMPACAEACPTGARVFGNLLDPNSEIRYVLAHKKVFRLKEDLGTEPKFWYYMD
ncbi:MAG: Fe-S-cluster-containing dehydrogenase component [Candidatus Latescibacterota bacterium]|jgi:Fe-S-cluster-containing dehydrogenase component